MKGQTTHIRVICDDAKPTKYIFYLCANKLYGWAMCYSLPLGYFKWMIDLELENCRDVALNVQKSFMTCITTSYLLMIGFLTRELRACVRASYRYDVGNSIRSLDWSIPVNFFTILGF